MSSASVSWNIAYAYECLYTVVNFLIERTGIERGGKNDTAATTLGRLTLDCESAGRVTVGYRLNLVLNTA